MDVQTLRNPDTGKFPAWLWPGGYTIVYICDDSENMCPDCVNDCENVHFDGDPDGWRIDGYYLAEETDGEGPGEIGMCANCNRIIFQRDSDGIVS